MQIVPGVRQDHLGQLYRIGMNDDGTQTQVPYKPDWHYEVRGTTFLGTENAEDMVKVYRIEADGREVRVA